MDILLDTTIQIDRIFKRKAKKEIEEIIFEHDCGSSTYVLGEFKSTIIKDFVTLYNIMQIEEDLAGVRDNINDTVFNRSFQRVYYIFNDLCKDYDEDFDLVKAEIREYPERLEKRFSYGLKSSLFNETNCHRAAAKVDFSGEEATIDGVKCRKTDNFCNSCAFWEKYKHHVDGLENAAGIQEKMKSALRQIKRDGEPLKGNICRSLGDCIISIEALQTEQKKVFTTNIKDFKPICDHIGVTLCEPKHT